LSNLMLYYGFLIDYNSFPDRSLIHYNLLTFIIIIIIIIFNYAVAAPVRVHTAGLYRYIIYIRGEPYRAG
jgi:hypothetical protein